MKLTLSITTPLFVDLIDSLFIAPFAFGLYHNRIPFFVVPFVEDKSGCFSNEKQAVITFTLCFTPSPFPLEVIFSIYIYIYIFVVEYSFKSLNTRKQLFQIQQASRCVLKNSCKKLFYDVKCNCFALT